MINPNNFQKYQIYSPRFNCRYRNILRYIKSYFGKNKNISILDIGCGTGTLIYKLQEKGYRIDGLDIDYDNIEKVKKFTKGETYIDDLTEFKTLKRYDLIICGEVLEHIKDDFEAVENIYRLLKDKGVLIITVPNDPNQWCLDDLIGFHFRRYTIYDMISMLEYSGFRNFKYKYIGYPFVTKLMYNARFRIKKSQLQSKNITYLKKLFLKTLCFVERIDDLFNTKKADKFVMGCVK